MVVLRLECVNCGEGPSSCWCLTDEGDFIVVRGEPKNEEDAA
jgi:hypothetical protein